MRAHPTQHAVVRTAQLARIDNSSHHDGDSPTADGDRDGTNEDVHHDAIEARNGVEDDNQRPRR